MIGRAGDTSGHLKKFLSEKVKKPIPFAIK